MTYRELQDWLNSLSQDQLDKEVALDVPETQYCLKIEYVQEATITGSGLEEGHPIIVVDRFYYHHRSKPANRIGEST